MGRFGRRIKLAFAILALFALSACAGNQLVMSGTALDTIGRSFVTTANLYNQLHDGGKVTDDEYRRFAVFAKQFQVIYPIAVDAWKAIELDPDVVNAEEVDALTDKFLDLKQRLIEFYSNGLSKLEVQ